MAKVLVIEDTDHIAMALQTLITFEGHGVIVAESAAQGYAMTLESEPDLIVMDLKLPDEDGLDLTRRIRATSGIKQPAILCVSSYTRGIEPEARIAGCDEVFSKTTFMVNYEETLKKYLGPTSASQTVLPTVAPGDMDASSLSDA